MLNFRRGRHCIQSKRHARKSNDCEGVDEGCTTSRLRGLRSAAWFGKADKDGFIHRSWMRNQGLPEDVFDGRPVIGICNTWSELTPCNAHLRTLADHVKRGVWEAGGLPLEFPVTSTGESNMRPTAMLYRNLVSMDVEESIRANPIDGVVLMVRLRQDHAGAGDGRGQLRRAVAGRLRRADAERQVPRRRHRVGHRRLALQRGGPGRHDEPRANSARRKPACRARPGHCMVMGTASTMASMVEALGLGLPQNAAMPAVDSRRRVLAHDAGRRIVDLVREDVRISTILTREAFENAIRVNGALGGSTNAVIHLLAIAGTRRRAADAR